MINMGEIKSRLARVVRDQSGNVRSADMRLVDDAAQLVEEVDRIRAAKSARWEQDGDAIVCSHCGGMALYGFMGEAQILTGHCPDCGREMEGENG